MKQEEVPQDAALFDNWHEITYAVDAAGNYVLTPSAGWDVSNLANLQAWQTIAEEIEAALAQIRRGDASPLLFHAVCRQMDAALLAAYLRLPRWRVRRHLRARPYARLSAELRRRYAALFGIAPAELDRVPQRVELPVDISSLEEGE